MKKLRIGIAGLGTVGAEVFHLLKDRIEFSVVAISAKNKSKDRGIDLSGVTWVDNPVDLALFPDIDVIVELIGGEADPAYSLVKTALYNKKNVVTANKALLAHHGVELARITEEKKCGLFYEAAVAGGIPIIKILREGFVANQISAVYGILNGTCNYILTTMERTGQDFSSALAEAQKSGYAEVDPALDVDGGDTAHKLALLTALAFGCVPDYSFIPVYGIRGITPEKICKANESGYKIKLVGRARKSQDGKIMQMVSPCLVAKSCPLAHLDSVLNGIMIEGDLIGQSFISGRGAGAKPTASAVLADLMDISRGITILPFAKPVGNLSIGRKANVSAWNEEMCPDIKPLE